MTVNEFIKELKRLKEIRVYDMFGDDERNFEYQFSTFTLNYVLELAKQIKTEPTKEPCRFCDSREKQLEIMKALNDVIGGLNVDNCPACGCKL